MQIIINPLSHTVSYKNNIKAAGRTVTKGQDYTINKASQTLKLNVSKKNYRAANLKKRSPHLQLGHPEIKPPWLIK